MVCESDWKKPKDQCGVVPKPNILMRNDQKKNQCPNAVCRFHEYIPEVNCPPRDIVVYRLGDSEQQMFCFGSYYSVRIVLGGRGVSSGRVGTVAMTYSPIPTAPRATYFSHHGRLLSKRLQMTTVITRAIVRYFAVFRIPRYSCQSSSVGPNHRERCSQAWILGDPR